LGAETLHINLPRYLKAGKDPDIRCWLVLSRVFEMLAVTQNKGTLNYNAFIQEIDFMRLAVGKK